MTFRPAERAGGREGGHNREKRVNLHNALLPLSLRGKREINLDYLNNQFLLARVLTFTACVIRFVTFVSTSVTGKKIVKNSTYIGSDAHLFRGP